MTGEIEMQTIIKNETERREKHCRCVLDISQALASLEDSLRAEKEFRAKLHRDDSTFAATIPSLKFDQFIQLCKKESCKEYDFITKWKIWARGAGLLLEEGDQ